MPDLKESIAARVKSLRLANSLSQAELADLAKTTVTTLSSIENGLSLPGVDVLFEISHAMGLSLSQFFEGPKQTPKFTARQLVRMLEKEISALERKSK